MYRNLSIYVWIVRAFIGRQYERLMQYFGTLCLRLGQRLVARYHCRDSWSHKLFLQCAFVDIEIHFSAGRIMHGPLYALHPSSLRKQTLIAKLNWVASRSFFSTNWEYGGASDLQLPGFRMLHMLPNGDAWFTFADGHAVLFLGEPKQRLKFQGDADTPRVYAYF